MIDDKSKFVFSHDKSPMEQIRNALEMSRLEFADAIGTDRSTVSRWERGKRQVNLTIHQIQKMELLLKRIGLSFQDIPPDLGPPQND